MSTRRFNVGGSGGSGVAAASAVTFDSSGLIIVSGTDVQAALESIDAYLDAQVVGTPSPWYALGPDGDVIISSDTTITRDMMYNNLTINTGIVLNTSGWRVIVAGTLTLNGTIADDGPNGSGVTGGAARAQTATLGAPNGGTGGTEAANGSNGASLNGLQNAGTGGAGGAGTGHTGGNASAQGVQSALSGGPYLYAYLPWVFRGLAEFGSNTGNPQTAGSGGGGGGGGAGGGNGGGGGGGGGHTMVIARNLAGAGVLRALGGDGANGTGTGGGGGGAGGGGIVTLVTRETSHPYTINVTPGTPGAGSGTGLNGNVGTSGLSFEHLGVI